MIFYSYYFYSRLISKLTKLTLRILSSFLYVNTVLSGMKRNWRDHYSHLLDIMTQYHVLRDAGERDTPCEEPTAAVIMAGCDDKSNIHVGATVPLEATPRQSNRAILRQDTTLESCDHNFEGIHKINPTVIHHMNQSTNPGDSLYSGGPDGTGRVFVSLHDALLDP